MMHLKDITLTAPRPLNPVDKAIEDASRVVCSLLVMGLKHELRFDRFGKVSIRINHPDDQEDGMVIFGVLIVNRQFPSDEFIEWDLSRRQNYMLDFVINVLKDVCLANGRDVAMLDKSRSLVLEHKFRRIIVGKELFPGPDKASTAHIECEQEMDEAKIYVAATLPNGQVRRVEVATSRPDEFILQNYFGKLSWTGSQAIVLHKRDGVALPASL